MALRLQNDGKTGARDAARTFPMRAIPAPNEIELRPPSRGFTMQRVRICLALASGVLLATQFKTRAHSETVHAGFEGEIPSAPSLILERSESVRRERPASATRARDPGGTLMPALRDGMVAMGSTRHRLVLFTFDDGPDTHLTPVLLHMLEQEQIRALFFLVAERMEGPSNFAARGRAIAQDIQKRGHYIASHTRTHAQLPVVSPERLDLEIVQTERVFASTLGGRPWLIRPPGGGRSARVDAYLSDRGYTQMLWNWGSGDFQVRTSDEVVRTLVRVMERRRAENGEEGGIVLMHDTHAWTVEAFPKIVRWFRERNCELLTRGEELYDFVDDPSVFVVPRADANATDEAPFVEPDAAWLGERQRHRRAEAEAWCEREQRRPRASAPGRI